jgi:hypothetical protein
VTYNLFPVPNTSCYSKQNMILNLVHARYALERVDGGHSKDTELTETLLEGEAMPLPAPPGTPPSPAQDCYPLRIVG